MNRARHPSRRAFLRSGLAAIGLVGLRSAPAGAALALPRAVAFHNLHTGESLRAVYYRGGRWVEEALREIAWVLRDHRTGDVHAIDPRLLLLVSALRDHLAGAAPFEVISGYRAPASNALLRATTTGVARDSLHVRGMAVDLRLPGCPLPDLRAAALALGRGGVGYYPESGFVHVDVGRVRAW